MIAPAMSGRWLARPIESDVPLQQTRGNHNGYVTSRPCQKAGRSPVLAYFSMWRRASRQLWLGEVRDLLQLAIDYGSADSPLCIQAAGLLRGLVALADGSWHKLELARIRAESRSSKSFR